MTEPLRLCPGAEAVRKFQKAGWTLAQRKGSHAMLTQPGYPWTLVPQHGELGFGLLRKLLRQTGLSIEEFNGL